MKIIKPMALVVMTASLTFYNIKKKAKQKEKKPNIIFSDSIFYQAISVYEGALKEYALTPNIDKIGAEGMRFDCCLVTNSISGSFRAAVLTSKYGHLNGFMSNEDGGMLDGSQQTFPKLLQQNGYQTGIIGKWHLGSQPTGFDYWEVLVGQGHYYNPVFLKEGGEHTETGYVTEIITDKAKAWMDQAKKNDKPFMLMMQHKAPHREWKLGPNELVLYKNVIFPEPANLFDNYENRDRTDKKQDLSLEKTLRLAEDIKIYGEEGTEAIRRFNTKQRAAWDKVYEPIIADFHSEELRGKELLRWKYQRYMQDYLACVASIDKSVGQIQEYLKEAGLDDNTIVIYSSDQDFYLGEHGWFDKRLMYEESLKTPLLIKWARVTKLSSVNTDLVSNLDFTETFLETAEMNVPEDMQGKSLVPLLEGETLEDWRQEHYYYYYEYPSWHMVKRHYGITTERYKLIHFYHDVDEWKMYDLKKDSSEMRNVYEGANYADVKKDLHLRLERLREKYGNSDELTKQYLDNSLKKTVLRKVS